LTPNDCHQRQEKASEAPLVENPVQGTVRRPCAHGHSRMLLTVLGVSVLMAHNKHANLGVHVPIDD
jgi:hypothetical protein